ncbi:MAG TPA: hypothetical protein PLO61_00700 [Fimbriimonadaceae bacterium]|mgnify:CR=1 FL=1|nr:hypothetical protein [Fimbriimonadaceae bacterium]HRJ32417.1 hypothetical protein [Fimbriimonadaceae bacterium]
MSPRRREAGNWSLIGLLVGVAIILVLVVIFVGPGTKVFGGAGSTEGPPPRKDGVGETVIGRSKAAAEDVVCRDQLRQIRMALTMRGPDEQATSISELRLDPKFSNCPFGDPYQLDATAQTVTCPHPGHEKY